MKNWKTTVGGLALALGLQLKGQSGWTGWIGEGLALVGPLILGSAAVDAKK